MNDERRSSAPASPGSFWPPPRWLAAVGVGVTVEAALFAVAGRSSIHDWRGVIFLLLHYPAAKGLQLVGLGGAALDAALFMAQSLIWSLPAYVLLLCLSPSRGPGP